MDELFRENFEFIQKKNKAAQELIKYTYRDAACSFRSYTDLPVDCEDAVKLYESISGDKALTEVTCDFAVFCNEFTAEIPVKLSFLQQDDDDEADFPIPKIAYLQNSFSDKAYRIFSERFERVSALYYPGFKEACEEVYYGRCSHALLPIYNSRDGMLMSFYKLLIKYDLKIIMACDTVLGDESVMRYALLSKNFSVDTEQTIMDISVVLSDIKNYGTFISACEIFGANIIMANSYPLEYADDRYGLILNLDITKTNINALCLYLEGSRVRYNILGIYK